MELIDTFRRATLSKHKEFFEKSKAIAPATWSDAIVRRIVLSVFAGMTLLLTAGALVILTAHTITKITDPTLFKKTLQINAIVVAMLITSQVMCLLNILSIRLTYQTLGMYGRLTDLNGYAPLSPAFLPPSAPSDHKATNRSSTQPSVLSPSIASPSARLGTPVSANVANAALTQSDATLARAIVENEDQAKARAIQQSEIDVEYAREVQRKESALAARRKERAEGGHRNDSVEDPWVRLQMMITQAQMAGSNAMADAIPPDLLAGGVDEAMSYEEALKLDNSKVTPPSLEELDRIFAPHFSEGIEAMMKRYIATKLPDIEKELATFKAENASLNRDELAKTLEQMGQKKLEELKAEYSGDLTMQYKEMIAFAILHFLGIVEEDRKEIASGTSALTSMDLARTTAERRQKKLEDRSTHPIARQLAHIKKELERMSYYPHFKNRIHGLLLAKYSKEPTEAREKELKDAMNKEDYDDMYRRVVENRNTRTEKMATLAGKPYYSKNQRDIHAYIEACDQNDNTKRSAIEKRLTAALGSNYAEFCTLVAQFITIPLKGYQGPALFALIGELVVTLERSMTILNSQIQRAINAKLSPPQEKPSKQSGK